MGAETIPMPSLEYQELVCGPNGTAKFEMVGRKIVTMLGQEGMIEPETDFLDVGCGCGRVARYLTETPIRSYVGFDRHPGMIQWCQEHIASCDLRFSFQYFDLQSAYVHCDSHAGTLSAASFAFPYSNDQFSGVLLASVFTHMPREEIRQYLKELYRVVHPQGKVLLSVFFSEADSYIDREINFFHRPSEFFALVDESGFARPSTTLHVPPKFGYEHNWYILGQAV